MKLRFGSTLEIQLGDGGVMCVCEVILLGVSFSKSKLRLPWIGSMSPNSLTKIRINFSMLSG